MGTLAKMERRVATIESPRVPLSDAFGLLGALGARQPSASGVNIDQKKARTYSAFFAAVNCIASDVGATSLKLFSRQDDGSKREENGHPAWRVTRNEPNSEMEAVSYREAKQGHLLTRGNAFSEIVRDGRNRVRELWPMPPDKTFLRRDENNDPFYVVRLNGQEFRVEFENMLHVSGLGGDGLHGWSVVKLAREAIGMGLAMEEYGARFFANASQPRGVLIHPEEITDQAAKRLRERWEAVQGGLEKAHRVAVLEQGIEWQEIGLAPEDSQFMESREFQVREISRWFRIPPHKIGDMKAGEPNSLPEQNIEYVQDTLEPWFTRWEQALTRQLLTERERDQGLFFEFNPDSRLKGDPKSRAGMIKTRFNTASWSINDIRKNENEDPIPSPGGDSYWIQAQNIPVELAVELSPTERALLTASGSGDGEAVKALVELRRDEIGRENEGPEETRQTTSAIRERLRLRETFGPLLTEAATRMVRAEVQDIRSEIGGRLADGPEAFVTFLRRFYSEDGRMSGIIERTMYPTMEQYGFGVWRAVLDAMEEDVSRERLEQFLRGPRGYFENFRDRYSASSRIQLEALVTNESEESREVVEGRMEEWEEGSVEGRPRGERVADRETVQLGEGTTKRALSATGIVFFRWRTTGALDCPICQALEGNIVGASEWFIRGGQNFEGADGETKITPKFNVGHPPAHPGCDCIVEAG